MHFVKPLKSNFFGVTNGRFKDAIFVFTFLKFSNYDKLVIYRHWI